MTIELSRRKFIECGCRVGLVAATVGIITPVSRSLAALRGSTRSPAIAA